MSFLIRSNRDFASKAVDPSCYIQRALAVSLTHKKEGNHILLNLPLKDSSHSMCTLHVPIYLLVLAAAELIFFTIAPMGLSFGFVLSKTALIVQQCFSNCLAGLTEGSSPFLLAILP